LLVSVPGRLRAPQQNGAVLAEPPLAEVGPLLAANRRRLALPPAALQGHDWTELRRQARQATVTAAQDYLRQAGEPVAEFGDTSLLMAGHQPELFHPGVWVKNFALYGLARAHGLTPINLVVDNDTAKSTALRLPVWAPYETSRPHVAHVPFDHWTGEVPYEERTVRDEDLFVRLPEHAAPLWKHWGFTPLLPAFWEESCRQAQRTPLLGERLAAARRTFERRWGCQNLELPVSRLCQTEPFAWFACHLLADLPRFHAIYNGCVHDYRRQYGLRSRNHPVPDLVAEGDWLEVPFWAWRQGQHQRGRLLARQTANALELRVGPEPWPALPLDALARVRAWQDLERRGLKVRSRALTNTLFARLFLADLFVHGIGGSKYDELTDAIVRRFYGWEPPGFLVLSATLLLPLPTFPATAPVHERLEHALRDVHCNPQRHLTDGPGAAVEVAEQKRAEIARQPADARARRERYQTLRTLTQKLRPYVAEREQVLREELGRCEYELLANGVVQRRDYAFCLYPEEVLRPFCVQFLSPNRS
jgi:hypothetical protein